MKEISYAKILALLETKKPGDKKWFLSLLDDEEQKKYEEEHVYAVMQMLRALRIRPHKKRIREMEEEIARLEKEMIKSGLRSTFEYDTTPLTLNFDFLQAGYIFEEEEKTDVEIIEEEPQTSFVNNKKDYDYNYLME